MLVSDSASIFVSDQPIIFCIDAAFPTFVTAGHWTDTHGNFNDLRSLIIASRYEIEAEWLAKQTSNRRKYNEVTCVVFHCMFV